MQKLEVSELRTTLFILTNKRNIIIFLPKTAIFKKIKKRPQKPGKNKKQLLAELWNLRNKKL